MSAEPSCHVTDPTVLRALAHPIRQRIIWELSVREHARAADLAAVLGEPANSVSYHLRELAKAEMIEEAPEHARDSRDRVWRISHPEGIYPDPGSPAFDMLNEEQLTWIRALLTGNLPKQDVSMQGEYLGGALLTKAEAKQMFNEVVEILERWREFGAKATTENPDNPERVFHRMVNLVGNR